MYTAARKTIRNRGRVAAPVAVAAAAAPAAPIPNLHLIELYKKFEEELGAGETGKKYWQHLCLLDSYHDFKGRGDVKIIEYLDSEYKRLLGIESAQDFGRKKIAKSSPERSGQKYYFTKFPKLFNNNSLVEYELAVMSFADLLFQEIPEDERNIKIYETENLKNVQYERIGKKIIQYLFPDIDAGAEVYICVDAVSGHLRDILSPLAGGNTNPIIYQTIVPTNITDSAGTSFNILSKKQGATQPDESRTEFDFVNNGAEQNIYYQTSNMLTEGRAQLSIIKGNYSSQNPYGFIWNLKIGDANYQVNLTTKEKDGPSVALLTRYFLCDTINSVCLKKAKEVGRNEVNLYNFLANIPGKNRDLYNRLVIDLKRTGDHEQASVVYYLNRANKRTIFITGDILSALFSYAIGNPTIMWSAYDKSYEIFNPISEGRIMETPRSFAIRKIKQLIRILKKVLQAYTHTLSMRNPDNSLRKLLNNMVDNWNKEYDTHLLTNEKHRLLYVSLVKLRALDIIRYLLTINSLSECVNSKITKVFYGIRQTVIELGLPGASENDLLTVFNSIYRAIGSSTEAPDGSPLYNKIIQLINSEKYTSFVVNLESVDLSIINSLHRFIKNDEFNITYSDFFIAGADGKMKIIKNISQLNFDRDVIIDIISGYNKLLLPIRGRNSNRQNTIQNLNDKIQDYFKTFSIYEYAKFVDSAFDRQLTENGFVQTRFGLSLIDEEDEGWDITLQTELAQLTEVFTGLLNIKLDCSVLGGATLVENLLPSSVSSTASSSSARSDTILDEEKRNFNRLIYDIETVYDGFGSVVGEILTTFKEEIPQWIRIRNTDNIMPAVENIVLPDTLFTSQKGGANILKMRVIGELLYRISEIVYNECYDLDLNESNADALIYCYDMIADIWIGDIFMLKQRFEQDIEPSDFTMIAFDIFNTLNTYFLTYPLIDRSYDMRILDALLKFYKNNFSSNKRQIRVDDTRTNMFVADRQRSLQTFASIELSILHIVSVIQTNSPIIINSMTEVEQSPGMILSDIDEYAPQDALLDEDIEENNELNVRKKARGVMIPGAAEAAEAAEAADGEAMGVAAAGTKRRRGGRTRKNKKKRGKIAKTFSRIRSGRAR